MNLNIMTNKPRLLGKSECGLDESGAFGLFFCLRHFLKR